MWKESYRLGVETIDRQHMKLFQMTEGLLKAIDGNHGPDVFKDAIGFLKDYAVEHFRDEEAYQASIHYDGMKEHVRQHQVFAETVLSFEKRLEDTDYSLNTVKELAGFLTAWLIYHVADADQRITGKAQGPVGEFAGSYMECFEECIQNVLEKMAGLDVNDIHTEKIFLPKMSDNVAIEVELTGNLSGKAVFGFTKDFAVKLFEAMTFTVVTEVDDLVCSALAEISNIISGNVVTLLSNRGTDCNIRTPQVLSSKDVRGEVLEGIRFNTAIGGLVFAVAGAL